MTGFEIIALFLVGFAGAAGGIALTALLGERKKTRFVAAVQSALAAHVDDIESGDIARPLSFRMGDVFVHALLRGDVPVWQLERKDYDMSAVGGVVAIVQRGWRAPETRDLVEVGALTPRLVVFADDSEGTRTFRARAEAELAVVLSASTKRCVLGNGRAFLEVARRGLAVDELGDALLRLDALFAVVAGRDALLPLPTPADEGAVAGPAGIPVPALGW